MQVVIRALSVLRALATKGKGATLQELHEELDIPVGSAHRVLTTLMEENFVTRSPTNKRYFLGPAARQLGEPAPHRTALLANPHQAVVDAAEASGETVFLTELIGARAVCVALVEGRHPLRLFVRIGQEMPLHAAASSRSLLAYLPEPAARRVLETQSLDAFTPDTPTTVDELVEHLALVRARGYDICDDELDRGVWAVAAPIFTSTGAVAASVTLAAAGNRMREGTARTVATDAVLTAARELSAELGFAGAEPTTAVGGPARSAR
ncbi:MULTISPECIES: IclR family transcriptional regulator [unclassified Amycolatopsis]|jgi:IclR family acetate operon transcriptional repressor|uniref:IclR family transcriptional regulator n=1 Tax=unclassified Amycolatopsis TaxID=2618356 RepID=UPI001C699D0B|nr:IclR family transcriptional regulator [Amycolatopsis sp. DSM 110486]QYN18281.1 IclR family transcriptional regulator [Amycolatopsis sp. DSM 110486]